jgi:hypothetical protein
MCFLPFKENPYHKDDQKKEGVEMKNVYHIAYFLNIISESGPILNSTAV